MGHNLKYHMIVTTGLLLAIHPAIAKADDDALLAVYQTYLKKYIPLRAEIAMASFEARKSGSDAAFEKKKAARLALAELHSDPAVFAELADIRSSGPLVDPFTTRLAEVLYDQFLFCQQDREAVEKIIEIETDLERALRNHRVRVDGVEMSSGEVRQLLRTTTDSSRAEKAWKAYMALGKVLDPKVRELFQLRNRFAEKMEKGHYFRLMLFLKKFTPVQFYRFLNLLNMDMSECYAKVKGEIDPALAAKFGIEVDQLRPWHYGDVYLRDAPVTPESDLDVLFKDADIVRLAREYFDGLGLPCDDIIKRSEFRKAPTGSIYPCLLGYEGEDGVRLACDIEPTLAGAEALFQNFAKAIYRKNMGKDVPLLLQQPPHGAVDEAFASLFGQAVRNTDFLTRIAHVSPKRMEEIAPIAERNMQWRTLIRAQWAQLVVRFEVSLCADPTRDLPHVWWEFEKKYQLLAPPGEEDARYGYALVPEILFNPMHHHSTLMGDILAEQVYSLLVSETMDKAPDQRTSFVGNKKAGQLVREKLMKPANLYHWQDLLHGNLGENFSNRKYLKKYCNIDTPRDFRVAPMQTVPAADK